MPKKYEVTSDSEYMFYSTIRENLQVIFDVGSKSESEFIDFEGEVHYFDPVPAFIEELKTIPTKNIKAFYNTFGLGNENKQIYYYPKYESFYDREKSCGVSDDENKYLLEVRKAKDYIEENNIQSIDFLKIDTEGHELDVLKGFEEHIQKVKIIQFEYGGTFLDSGLRLADVIQFLTENNFHKFNYLTDDGLEPVSSLEDHFHYCNIVCIHTSSDCILFS
jgi:FkbM family methyltransferase